MTSENFFTALHAAYRDALDKPFLTLPDGRSLSYGEMDARSAQMAGALRALGASPGDRIVMQVDKSPKNIALYLGAMRAGLVYVPLNTAYTAEEVRYFLEDAAPKIFVCTRESHDQLAHVAKEAGVDHVLTLTADGAGTLCDAAFAAKPDETIVPRAETDLAVILYTSGTTGRSKGAMLTHENLASNAATLNALWEFSETDVLLHALPIFHIHGLFVALHTAMLSACEILFLPKFDVGDVRKALPRASVIMGVPTFYTRLLAEKDFGKGDTAHMRLFISGSAPLTIEAFNTFEERTGHRILERYGMSEAGMIASNPLDGERIAGTVGYALPGINVRIAGEAGAPGEVEVKGPNICAGYWKKPDKTQEAFTEDGWFRTGDVGMLSDDGRLSLVGREKDLIIAGGFNIYPIEIEQILDAVAGVAESAVVGVPHADMGEGVVAALVADGAAPDEDMLAAALSPLAKFKRPRKFYWLDALPRNTMGKVQKQALRERFKDAFTNG
ncbi:AMP-binding protein [Hyphococcus luteus]|uniref:Malonyl-CoA synthase n=1 Tax=Hyphococcus luteus TaxID=2058213 RepID=A0A2S7K4K2_9PROT|nr:AMP-binding protein [Marinicaulis flavus]PQA87435.1 malonyl-CoA synthase [Marinicaulis flavus]